MSTLNRSLTACVVLATMAVGPTIARAGADRSLFLPDGFASLGTLNESSGTINIDTDTLTITGFGNGVAASSEGGGVEMAVFTFDQIDLGSGVTINVTGNRGLVLGSKSNFNFDSILNLSGADGAMGSVSNPDVGGDGGPGADDGTPGSATGSSPPGSTRGDGGQATDTPADPLADSFGHGMGGGLQVEQPINNIGGGGGGGGYGGAGGQAGGYAGVGVYGPGGTDYGDDLLTELFGGSGGGGGRFKPESLADTNLGGGGGGGGALELIASGMLTVSGTIDVTGGIGGDGANICGGGGGSGGGLILAAYYLDVDGAEILATGGDGYRNAAADKGGLGGGGGGGRVAFYTNALAGLAGVTVDISGGLKGGGTHIPAEDGLDGSFRYFGDGIGAGDDLAFYVPEPSTFCLMLLALPALLRRKRRAK